MGRDPPGFPIAETCALSAASGRLGAAYQAVVAVSPWPGGWWRDGSTCVAREKSTVPRVCARSLRVVARCCALTCVPAFSYKESRVEEAVQLRTADERGGHLMERAATGGRAPRVGDAVRLEPTVTIFVGSPRVGRWPSKTSPWASRSSARTPSLRWRAVAFRRGKCELYCQIRGARRPWCVPGGSS